MYKLTFIELNFLEGLSKVMQLNNTFNITFQTCWVLNVFAIRMLTVPDLNLKQHQDILQLTNKF